MELTGIYVIGTTVMVELMDKTHYELAFEQGNRGVLVVNYFRDGSPYHVETSPLIFSAKQWTGFYMIGPSSWKS